MTFAALLLPIALMQAMPAPAPASDRFAQCVAAIDTDATKAYEDAMQWAADTQSMGAYRCAAMALIAQDRFYEGAQRLESLASALNPDQPAAKAELYSQAGNAWLLARDAAHARSALTRAITTVESDPQQLPDLLIDRSRAYSLEADYRHAEEDLSRALDIRAQDALALSLRAAARMHQRSFELAEADAEAAVALEPRNVAYLVMLGHVRESKRTGTPVEEQ